MLLYPHINGLAQQPPHLVPSACFPGLSEVELEGPRQAEKNLIVIPVHLTT